MAPPWVMLEHVSQSQCPVGVSSMVLRVLGFLVDTATGNKVPRPGANSWSVFSRAIRTTRWLGNP